MTSLSNRAGNALDAAASNAGAAALDGAQSLAAQQLSQQTPPQLPRDTGSSYNPPFQHLMPPAQRTVTLYGPATAASRNLTSQSASLAGSQRFDATPMAQLITSPTNASGSTMMPSDDLDPIGRGGYYSSPSRGGIVQLPHGGPNGAGGAARPPALVDGLVSPSQRDVDATGRPMPASDVSGVFGPEKIITGSMVSITDPEMIRQAKMAAAGGETQTSQKHGSMLHAPCPFSSFDATVSIDAVVLECGVQGLHLSCDRAKLAAVTDAIRGDLYGQVMHCTTFSDVWVTCDTISTVTSTPSGAVPNFNGAATAMGIRARVRVPRDQLGKAQQIFSSYMESTDGFLRAAVDTLRRMAGPNGRPHIPFSERRVDGRCAVYNEPQPTQTVSTSAVGGDLTARGLGATLSGAAGLPTSSVPTTTAQSAASPPQMKAAQIDQLRQFEREMKLRHQHKTPTGGYGLDDLVGSAMPDCRTPAPPVVTSAMIGESTSVPRSVVGAHSPLPQTYAMPSLASPSPFYATTAPVLHTPPPVTPFAGGGGFNGANSAPYEVNGPAYSTRMDISQSSGHGRGGATPGQMQGPAPHVDVFATPQSARARVALAAQQTSPYAR